MFISNRVKGLAGSVFSKFLKEAKNAKEIYPLHVGDSWLTPPKELIMENLKHSSHPHINKYAPPGGIPELREKIAELWSNKLNTNLTKNNVMIAAGATGALASALASIVDPGDEVIISAPYWPLIAGIVKSLSAKVIEAPFILDFSIQEADKTIELLEQLRTDRTRAIYINTPNNPTGKVLPKELLYKIGKWAHDRKLWIISDEVYEDLIYKGSHTSLYSLFPHNTVVAHAFSKSFGVAGYRCGFLIANDEIIKNAIKVSTYLFYSTTHPVQVAALKLLNSNFSDWIKNAVDQYREIGRYVAEQLKVPPAEGSTFLFLDLSRFLDNKTLDLLLEELAKEGVLLAPGYSFGPFDSWVRLCFTAIPPEKTKKGVDILLHKLYS